MTDTPLSDDVVETAAKAIEATTGYSGDIARRQARAALEAARYGEAIDLLRGIRWKSADRDNMEFSATITYSQMDRIRALLSSIGASKP